MSDCYTHFKDMQLQSNSMSVWKRIIKKFAALF